MDRDIAFLWGKRFAMGQDDSISDSRPPRQLTPPEFEQLVNALGDAFDRFGLQQLALFELGIDLSDIVPPGTVQEAAFELVRWAVRNGRLDDLVAGAIRRNPGNAELRRFDREVWRAKQAPEPVRPGVRKVDGETERTVEGSARVPPAEGDPSNGTDKGSLGQKFTAFFKTIPGVLTGLAAVITAAVALLAALNDIGMFDGNSNSPPTPSLTGSGAGTSVPLLVTTPSTTPIRPTPTVKPPTSTPVPPTATPESTPTAIQVPLLESPAPPRPLDPLDPIVADHVAAATVLLSAVITETENGNTSDYGQCFLGSGSIVSPDGRFILTTSHVLSLLDRAMSYAAETEAELKAENPERQVTLQFGEIAVAIVDAANSAPDREYRAQVVKQDQDLALLRITGDSPGFDHERPLSRAYFALDLGGAQSGQPVTLVGYAATAPVTTHGPGCPQVPGDRSIQMFPGTVSGVAGPNKDQLRVTASGSGGIVGGSVVNGEGQLIGIPAEIEQMAASGGVEVIPIERATTLLEAAIQGISTPTPTAPTAPA